jgi:hypothetical protein
MTRGGAADRRAAASTRRLAVVTVLALVVLVAVAAFLGLWIIGPDGARSAALGVGLTAVLFGGGLLGLVRTSSGSRSFAPVLAAFSLRLVLYAAALALVTRAEWVHGPSLASATAASIAVMIAVELVALAREPVAELEPLGPTGTGGGSETTERSTGRSRDLPDAGPRGRDARPRGDGA